MTDEKRTFSHTPDTPYSSDEPSISALEPQPVMDLEAVEAPLEVVEPAASAHDGDAGAPAAHFAEPAHFDSFLLDARDTSPFHPIR